MTMFGIDATEEVATNALHGIGASFVMRYLSRYSWKVIRSNEYHDYVRAGLLVGLVFEDGAANAQGGYDAGKGDAIFAMNQAKSIVGQPAQVPTIYFAVDYDTAGGASHTDAYFDGVAAVLGRSKSGPYGGYEVIARQYDRGFRGLWQTYAWSGGRLHPHAQVYQYSNDHYVGGIGVDFDRAYDLAAFWNHRSAPADPNHYGRFPTGPFSWRNRQLHERQAVKDYDRLRKHPVRNHARLRATKIALGWLAERVYWEAHNDPDRWGVKHVHPNLPPMWGKFNRGWRFQQLYKRSKGLVLGKDFKP